MFKLLSEVRLKFAVKDAERDAATIIDLIKTFESDQNNHPDEYFDAVRNLDEDTRRHIKTRFDKIVAERSQMIAALHLALRAANRIQELTAQASRIATDAIDGHK